MKNSLVSVVISVYNKEKYISEAIESCLSQNHLSLDIIVVDDGSTDNSYNVIEKYSNEYNNIRCYTQKNSGVATCRNKGIAEARGKYIIFLDGDDYLYPDYLQAASHYMDIHPDVDLLHVGWDYVDESGKFISKVSPVQRQDYLYTLLLGNIFAIHAVFCRLDFIKKVGTYNYYTVTDDWEYWIRCAKEGARFHAFDAIFVATRRHPANNKKVRSKQGQRFFPIIDKVFSTDFGLPKLYQDLESTCRLRHHFFLFCDYVDWGWTAEAEEQFHHALRIVRYGDIPLAHYSFAIPRMSLNHAFRLSMIFLEKRSFTQLSDFLSKKCNNIKAYHFVKAIISGVSNRICLLLYKFSLIIQKKIQRSQHFSAICSVPSYNYDKDITIHNVKDSSLEYISLLRLSRDGVFCGYRHSFSCNKPVLYATLSALLVKNLYGVHDDFVNEEIEYVLNFQNADGFFRDPVISCPEANFRYHGWGWSHLTLIALMTVALYNVPVKYNIPLVAPYECPNKFRNFLRSKNWRGQAASIGNELQNIGVLLQYARDFQGTQKAGSLLEVLYDTIDDHQNHQYGLYGDDFSRPEFLLKGVMSAYHLWLLYFYDNRPIPQAERAIDSLLETQNILGGYGVRLNSSACEDIDTIDPLIRLSALIDYRREEVQASLKRALPHLLSNMNGDGGFVFRRHEANTIIHKEMFSMINESNIFYTWFRTLTLAYLLTSVDDVPVALQYNWNFKRAPGHQFII